MKVLNFGSLNIDNVYRLSHIVRPGETISAVSNAVAKVAACAKAKAGLKFSVPVL